MEQRCRVLCCVDHPRPDCACCSKCMALDQAADKAYEDWSGTCANLVHEIMACKNHNSQALSGTGAFTDPQQCAEEVARIVADPNDDTCADARFTFAPTEPQSKCRCNGNDWGGTVTACGAPCFGDECELDKFNPSEVENHVRSKFGFEADLYEISGLVCSALPNERKAYRSGKSGDSLCGADCNDCFEGARLPRTT